MRSKAMADAARASVLATANEITKLRSDLAAATALLTEAARVVEPFAEVGKERESPWCRAIWRFERAFISDDELRAASALHAKITAHLKE